MKCNGEVIEVDKAEVAAEAAEVDPYPSTRISIAASSCDAVFWAGAHFTRLQALVDSVTLNPRRPK